LEPIEPEMNSKAANKRLRKEHLPLSETGTSQKKDQTKQETTDLQLQILRNNLIAMGIERMTR
jgi:hypothetical protein